jgi:hypothetical protein
MATLLTSLLGVVRVAIISGGGWPQFQKQVLQHLPESGVDARLSLLPTCGTRFYQYRDGNWNMLYAEDFSAPQKADIIKALTGWRVERSQMLLPAIVEPETWERLQTSAASPAYAAARIAGSSKTSR